MIVPYTLAAWLLGPAFPTLVGALVGLSIVVTAARRGYLLKATSPAWDFAPRKDWQPEWCGLAAAPRGVGTAGTIGARMAWAPYLLVAVLLLLTRIPAAEVRAVIAVGMVSAPSIMGTPIRHQTNLLTLPGTVFVLVSVITFFLHHMRPSACAQALRSAGRTVFAASVALIFTVPMVQVFIHSGGGSAQYEEMPKVLAGAVETLARGAWPLLAPWIGGLGAAVAGSNTVSNMMFALFQFDVGQRIGVDPTWIVALQAVGGAAGNMICVHNVVAASAVVGLLGREGMVLRITLLPFVYYALLAGSAGYAIVWYHSAGWFNAGSGILMAVVVSVTILLVKCRPAPRATASGTGRGQPHASDTSSGSP
jgi:lactate permease